MNNREKAAIIYKAKQNNTATDLDGPNTDQLCKCRHKYATHSAINPFTQAQMCKYTSCHCKEFRPYTGPEYTYIPARVQAEQYRRQEHKKENFSETIADEILSAKGQENNTNLIKPFGFSMAEVEAEAKRTGRPIEDVHAEFVRRSLE